MKNLNYRYKNAVMKVIWMDLRAKERKWAFQLYLREILCSKTLYMQIKYQPKEI